MIPNTTITNRLSLEIFEKNVDSTQPTNSPAKQAAITGKIRLNSQSVSDHANMDRVSRYNCIPYAKMHVVAMHPARNQKIGLSGSMSRNFCRRVFFIVSPRYAIGSNRQR